MYLFGYVGNTDFLSGGVGKTHNHHTVDHPDGVWVEPAPLSVITGNLAQLSVENEVIPIRVPGYWQTNSGIPSNAPARPSERVIYHLHGGAYILCSAHPSDITAKIREGLLAHLTTVHRTFSVEYRLSIGPPFAEHVANPYPAALIDALSGYVHLLQLGFKPSDIILCGDSAGANLALALVRYLIENREVVSTAIPGIRLEPAGTLILVCPWADMGPALDIPTPPFIHQLDLPINMDQKKLKYAQRVYTGKRGRGVANTDPYISPASPLVDKISFRGFPRTFLNSAGVEWLAEPSRVLYKRMAADMGEGTGPGQVMFYEAPDGMHDYLAFEWHEPERTETLQIIRKWLE